MSITDSIASKPHINVANGILNIQRLALQMASFGARKRLDIWIEPVDDFTLDYLAAYFSSSIKHKEDENQSFLVIRNEYSDIYVQLKQD